ncbi:MAG: acetyltransferase [Schwartzia succinivorans]|nr:acetyltransferase [Schwartzia succinivorans]
MTLAIYCAGGLGKEVVSLVHSVWRWDFVIFVDDVTDEEWHAGVKVYRFEDLKDFPDYIEFIIANGEPEVREKLYHKIKTAGYPMATIYSKDSVISSGAIIGEGCIVNACEISSDVVIEPNVFIQTKAVIGHDAVIGEHSVISSFCFIGGGTRLEKKVYMGPGSMVKDHICIGESAIASLGAVILRDVNQKSIMVGNPAKRIGENAEHRVFNIFE